MKQYEVALNECLNSKRTIYDRHAKVNVKNPEWPGDEICEVVSWLSLVEQAGSVEKFLLSRGHKAFPAPLQQTAAEIEATIRRLKDQIVQWAASRGVSA